MIKVSPCAAHAIVCHVQPFFVLPCPSLRGPTWAGALWPGQGLERPKMDCQSKGFKSSPKWSKDIRVGLIWFDMVWWWVDYWLMKVVFIYTTRNGKKNVFDDHLAEAFGRPCELLCFPGCDGLVCWEKLEWNASEWLSNWGCIMLYIDVYRSRIDPRRQWIQK